VPLILILGCTTTNTSVSRAEAEHELVLAEQRRAEEIKRKEQERHGEIKQTKDRIPEPQYHHAILVLGRKGNLEQKHIDTAVGAVEKLILAYAENMPSEKKYNILNDKILKERLYSEMAQLNIDPNVDSGKYLQQSLTQGNLLLYVSLEDEQREVSLPNGQKDSLTEVIVEVLIEDLITARTMIKERKAISTFSQNKRDELSEERLRNFIHTEMGHAILRQLAKIPAPEQNLYKIIAHSTDQEKREKLNAIFRKMEEKGLIKFEQVPFIGGANFCLLFRYLGGQSKLVDLLQEYLRPLHMKVETQGYAIIVSPKPEEEF
jgi:DNA segregation ATPase FtsK/SpoIIIE-like protein